MPKPTIKTRVSNGRMIGDKYTVDLEFKSDTPDQQVFGVNLRLWFDSFLFESEMIMQNFQGGYDPQLPYPPILKKGTYASRTMFGFHAATVYAESAIQLMDKTAPPIVLSTTGFTKICELAFRVKETVNLETCPPIVMDLEYDITKGGFLPGSDGVVVTVVDPRGGRYESAPSIRKVEQFNWEYFTTPAGPYGPFGKVVPCPAL